MCGLIVNKILQIFMSVFGLCMIEARRDKAEIIDTCTRHPSGSVHTL